MKLNETMRKFVTGQERRTVLGTGFTLKQFQDDLDHRESVLEDVENYHDKCHENKRDALKDALEASGSKKMQYIRRAKTLTMKLNNLSDLRGKLLVEQLFLTKLMLHEVSENFASDTAAAFDFTIDISELDADELASQIDRADAKDDEAMQVIEEVDKALERTDGVDMVLDVEEMRETVEELEADEIESGIPENPVEDEMNDKIQEELDRLQSDGDVEADD
jgi:hypothetical protein